MYYNNTNKYTNSNEYITVLIWFFHNFSRPLPNIMSDLHAITTPPRRRVDHLLAGRPHHNHPHHPHQPHMSSGGDSCKNTPNLSRKIDAYQQHARFDGGGSQSAKSSPLPHRRLDKLEGCIRDKPSPLSLRRRLESMDDANPSGCGGGGVGADLEPQRRNTDCGCAKNPAAADNNAYRDTLMMRRRVDSDCGCPKRTPTHQTAVATMSPQVSRRQPVMGEPGCFSSPVHRRNDPNGFDALNFASPAKSVLGEPGVFASPARSISSVVSTIGEDDDLGADLEATDVEAPLQPDKTVVSGWLKFRDNKRVNWFCSIFYNRFYKRVHNSNKYLALQLNTVRKARHSQLRSSEFKHFYCK